MWARRSAAIVTMLLFALPVASLATVLLPSTASAAEPCTGQSDPVSGLRCDIGQGISNAAGAVTQSFADQAEQALTKWVADTAIWLLQQLANVVFDSTSPVLSVDWFRAH
ncbi:MAG TPA: hypothetical protein VOB72_20840, partial [Candidatus Dormibacteraeota bacterium]|nr:hypothetical protein [Candidatus Dormibacteraeota bacterium]